MRYLIIGLKQLQNNNISARIPHQSPKLVQKSQFRRQLPPGGSLFAPHSGAVGPEGRHISFPSSTINPNLLTGLARHPVGYLFAFDENFSVGPTLAFPRFVEYSGKRPRWPLRFSVWCLSLYILIFFFGASNLIAFWREKPWLKRSNRRFSMIVFTR